MIAPRSRSEALIRGPAHHDWPSVPDLHGLLARAPKARVRGQDVAGRVEAVGKDVMQFQPGDDVLATCDGSFRVRGCSKVRAVWAPEERLLPGEWFLTVVGVYGDGSMQADSVRFRIE